MEENTNLELYNRFKQPPQEALKEITGGRLKGLTDISPMWRIQALTEAFGACGEGWEPVLMDRWTEKLGDEIACFIHLRMKIKGFAGCVEGIGGAMLLSKEKNGLHADDEAYKKAWTDAISSCCKQLGIGANVYWMAGSKYQTAEPPISPSLVNSLRAKLTEYKIDEKLVCDRYKLESLDAMTKPVYETLFKEWNEVKGALSGLNRDDQQPEP